MEPSTNVDGEVLTPALAHRPCPAASMEPSTNVDGESPAPRARRRPSASFNGAVDERRRRALGLDGLPGGVKLLQWSRRRTSTESRRRQPARRYRPVASMEPSTNVDGEECARADGRGADAASMEPSTNVDGEELQQARVAWR